MADAHQNGHPSAPDGAVATRSPSLPPGPRLPRAAQTVTWIRRPLDVLERCQRRYGDMFTLRIANEGTWVMVSDPAAVKQVFQADPSVARAGEANKVLLPVLGSHSVLLLDEAAHLEQRKLMLPPFHGKRMQRYQEVMARVAAEEIERWPLGERVSVWPRMQAVTLEVILRAVFGIENGERMGRLRSELRRVLDMLSNPRRLALLTLIGPQRVSRLRSFNRVLEPVDRMLYEEIAARREAPDLSEREDILSLLLQARHEDGSPMSDRELRDELMTLLVAGHETTATSLAWAIERLVRHPEKLDRLTAETRAGDGEYLDAVIKETLRLRPVIALVVRHLTAPLEVGGRVLPAGATVAPCIYLVHRRPEIYPEPERFRPERFLERSPGTYTWIPFGGGIRRCLGASFAEFEMSVVLRELVARRSLRPARLESERIVRRAITMVPRRGAEVVVEPAAERGAPVARPSRGESPEPAEPVRR